MASVITGMFFNEIEGTWVVLYRRESHKVLDSCCDIKQLMLGDNNLVAGRPVMKRLWSLGEISRQGN